MTNPLACGTFSQVRKTQEAVSRMFCRGHNVSWILLLFNSFYYSLENVPWHRADDEEQAAWLQDTSGKAIFCAQLTHNFQQSHPSIYCPSNILLIN